MTTCFLTAAVCLGLVGSGTYDPLALEPSAAKPVTHDFDIHDTGRDRTIPIRVYLPASESPAPVVLFSHGLGGSRTNNPYLGNHWARRGYVVVFVQHPGSDESVWRDAPVGERIALLQKQASLANFSLRVKDIPAVLDALTAWNTTDGHLLKGRLDLGHVGMSGHSFGANTTQAVSGQSFRLGGSMTDPRIKAAVAMSPGPPRLGDPSAAFWKVSIPWLLLTGTNDSAKIVSGLDAPDRLKVFPALPAGHKYQLVLDGAEHSAFSERALPGDSHPRNPNHHRAILAVTTAFWDATLKADPAAQAWLDDEKAVRTVIEPKDRWEAK
jgi:predicted dienelactone hydrolase